MDIESNISAVVARTQRLASRDIPAALQRALKPSPTLLQQARETAERTLLALAKPNQRAFVPAFLETIVNGIFGTGFFVRMKNPFPTPKSVQDFQAARSAVSPQDLSQNLFLKSVQEFEQMMEEWVATEKDKDQRDAGRSDADIGNFISFVMLTPMGGNLIVRSGPNKGRTVREVLSPHITEFLQRRQSRETLTPGTVDIWLRAVLAAWCALFRRILPERIMVELKAARTELNI